MNGTGASDSNALPDHSGPTLFPNLFSKLVVGPREFRNRIFSTGHMTCLINDHSLPDERFVAYHEARARGGAGLIITEAAKVHATGGWRNLDASTDACIPGYRRTADAVHQHGCAIFGQLGHSGAYGISTRDGTLGVSYAPSQSKSDRSHNIARALPASLLKEYVVAYGQAAARMTSATLDGIEILASHSLLPAQFLNPVLNRRTDDYGGSLENRMRFLREIIESVRNLAGDDVVVGVRISADEMDDDGNDPEEIFTVCRKIADDGGIDYLNIIAGSMINLRGSIHVVPPMAIETGYLAPLGQRIRQAVNIPIFLAGRINQPHQAEEILINGHADMIGMTRAQIADPDMARKAQSGAVDDIRACIACNQACIGHMQSGFGISCIQHPETGREREFGTKVMTNRAKHVLVAGGGPAGMKAAAVAAERGHKVTLIEKSAALGGQVLLAQQLPGRTEFGGIVLNLEREMKQHGVERILNQSVTCSRVEDSGATDVVVATGATPYSPPLLVDDDAQVIDAWQIIRKTVRTGDRVLVADWRGDWIGLGVAEMLARDGCSVTLAVNGRMAGETLQMYVRDNWIGRMHALGVRIVPYMRLVGADSSGAWLQHAINAETILFEDIETVVTSLGHRSVNDLADELQAWHGNVHEIGDCLSPRSCEEAVYEGLKVGFAIT